VSSWLTNVAIAQTNDEAQHQAASLFDRGVQQFAEHRYESAARSFLAADDARTSKDALRNALVAAQRGALPLLIAWSAERLLQRDDLDPQTHSATQAALELAAQELARIDLRCEPVPCTARIDGQPTPTGRSIYALPGAHELLGENEAGARALQSVHCDAGALCEVTLTLQPLLAPETPSAAPLPVELGAGPGRAGASERGVQPSAAEPAAASARDGTEKRTKERTNERLPLAVFIGTSGAAVALAALTTWSGVKALRARRLHESDYEAYDDHEVRRLARRTDYFLGGSLLCAGAALATGLLWVKFGRKQGKVALSPWLPGGVLAEGRF